MLLLLPCGQHVHGCRQNTLTSINWTLETILKNWTKEEMPSEVHTSWEKCFCTHENPLWAVTVYGEAEYCYCMMMPDHPLFIPRWTSKHLALGHPSPLLTLSDFRLFPKMKKHLQILFFQADEDIKAKVKQWLQLQDVILPPMLWLFWSTKM